MSYTQLQSDIGNWFARTDLPTATFISLAEQEMNRTLRLQGMEEISRETPGSQLDNGLWKLPYPADFLQLKHIERGGYRLEFVSNNQMNVDAGPAYTIADESILLAGNDPVDLTYYKSVPVLSDTNTTNLFTTLGYDALLYLALDHAANYMMQPGDYRQKGIERMAEIQQQDYKAAHSGAPLVQRG